MQKLAEQAPLPQRSKVTPFLGVVLTLRNKGYSYEKVADFLTEQTGREFTRSQIFAFVQRNSTIFGTVDRNATDEESEPLANQLAFDHSHAILKCLPKGYQGEAKFIPGSEVVELAAPPALSGLVGKTFHFTYRMRLGGSMPVAEWWDNEKWAEITEDSIRHVAEEFKEKFWNKRKGKR